MTDRFYGWKKGAVVEGPKFCAPLFAGGLPPSVDLEPELPEVWNQKELSSCTAFAGAALSAFLNKKLKWKIYTPSKLAIYYWERVLQGSVDDDNGATLVDCMNVLRFCGAPNETLFPYDTNKLKIKPPTNVEKNGRQHLIIDPLQVNQNLHDMKACLATGFPFIFGFLVHQSFEDNEIAKTGIMPIPKRHEKVLGGHAVCAIGFDDSINCFKIRNSWGASWGKNGHFYMPYNYAINGYLAADLWTARNMTGWRSSKKK